MTEENRIITQMLTAITNYPTPDPAWDYTEIFHRCHSVKQAVEKLINYMGTIESATPESDRIIKQTIDSIGQHLNTTRRLLDE